MVTLTPTVPMSLANVDERYRGKLTYNKDITCHMSEGFHSQIVL